MLTLKDLVVLTVSWSPGWRSPTCPPAPSPTSAGFAATTRAEYKVILFDDCSDVF